MAGAFGLYAYISVLTSLQISGAELYENVTDYFYTQDDSYMRLAASKEAEMDESIWILESEPVSVSFDTKGYTLYKGGSGILATPVENQLRLIAVKGQEKIVIVNIADLKNRVFIKTPEQALEFVRLFTSIKTHFLLPDSDYIEPRLTHDSMPGIGEFTPGYQKRINIELEKLNQAGKDFVIERNLIDKSGKLFRVVERVTENGEYSLEKKLLIDKSSPIVYPIYE